MAKLEGFVEIGRDEEGTYFGHIDNINPFDLPYHLFDENHTLNIYGNVNVSKYHPNNYAGKKIPDFSNVIISGIFDCSNQFFINKFPRAVLTKFICRNTLKKEKRLINENTVLPRGCVCFDLSYSIDSLDILIDKLPRETQRLIVQRNLIKASFLEKDPVKLDSAKRFQEKYPNIIVTTENGDIILSNTLRDLGQEKKLEKTPEPKVKQPVTNVKIDKKSDDDLDRNDIVAACRDSNEIFEKLSDDELYRIISIVLKNSKIQTFKRKRGSDEVICISSADKDKAVKQIKNYLVEQNLRRAKKEIEQKKEINQDQEIIVNQKQQVNEETNEKPEEIKKYIPKNLLKIIQKEARDDRFLPILEEINAVNKNPLAMKKHDSMPIIVDGKFTMAKNVERKKTNVLGQSFDGNLSEDRRRIIWSVCKDEKQNPVIVCYGHIQEHGQKYKKLINKAAEYADRTVITKEITKDWVDVESLLSTMNGVQNTPKPTYNR